MTVSLVPGRTAGPTKAFRRNAQPAPRGPRRNPAQRFRWGEEEQGSERSFRRQAETEMSGLCDDVGAVSGVWGLAPNKRIEQSRPWRDAQFCRMGPILHRLPVSPTPVFPLLRPPFTLPPISVYYGFHSSNTMVELRWFRWTKTIFLYRMKS